MNGISEEERGRKSPERSPGSGCSIWMADAEAAASFSEHSHNHGTKLFRSDTSLDCHPHFVSSSSPHSSLSSITPLTRYLCGMTMRNVLGTLHDFPSPHQVVNAHPEPQCLSSRTWSAKYRGSRFHVCLTKLKVLVGNRDDARLTLIASPRTR